MTPRVVEVRVPTYRRPRLLRRALDSLVAQGYKDWRCIVFDDSPDREAEWVCNGLADPRIVYVSNNKRLGAGPNLDQCFRKRAYCAGDLFCVLEDDNYLQPTCLE